MNLTVLALIALVRSVPIAHAITKNVFVAIATRVDPEGSCFPTQVQLAADTAFSERSVRDALDWLEREGFIERTVRRWRSGARRSDRITIKVERLEDYRQEVPHVEDEVAATGTTRRTNRQDVPNQPAPGAGFATLELTKELAKEPSDPNGSAPRRGAVRDFRQELFDRGTATVAALTGRQRVKCRALIGSWLALANDDAATVLAAIDAAEEAELAEAVTWIEARLKARRSGATGRSPATSTPATSAATAERNEAARQMAERGQWPVGGSVWVAEESAEGAAWAGHFARFGVRPRWTDCGRSGRGWWMPSALPPMPAAAVIAAGATNSACRRP